MKWIIITITILTLSTIYACTSTKSVETDTAKETTPNLEGTWTMYKEICCGRRNVERAGDEMLSPKKLVFKGDNQVAITDLKKNETTTSTYKLETTENSGTSITYINFDSARKGILSFEEGNLIIDYGYMDLQKEFYKKQ